MAGGVALNSVVNERVLRETPFGELHVQRPAGDGGGAVGAALYAYHALLGKARTFIMDHAYWVEEDSTAEIRQFLSTNDIRHEVMENDEDLLDRVVDALQVGRVVGWFQGPFEWGPRTL